MDPTSTHSQDDLDMAKLQKSLKQQQRRSIARDGRVAKLSPAEIRSLNHSAVASKTGSIRSVDARSLHRLSSSTPPGTPDESSNIRAERRPSSNLPTPPLSPQNERRDSNASARKLHAPQPISPHKTAAALNGHSRPSSVNSYRGVATYRGPEITRSDSLTMLQHPSQQIVSNPLSNFSRPRQSTLTSSPDKPRPEQLLAGTSVSSLSQQDERDRVSKAQTLQAREQSPVRHTESPVSLEEQDAQASSSSDFNRDIPVPPAKEVKTAEALASETAKDEIPVQASAKPKTGWRKSLTAAAEPDQDQVKLRREYKRRSFGWHRHDCIYAIQYADTKAGPPPELRDSLKTELPSTQGAAAGEVSNARDSVDSEFGQHPAVRPLSVNETPAEDSEAAGKGKAVEVVSETSSIRSSTYPSYSRCSCCGRIQKPGGFMSELSPLLENENLRTNFSFEAGRSSTEAHRRSTSWSSDGTRRYTPIIPMEVGDEVRQAAIAPRSDIRPLSINTRRSPGVAINKPGDIIGPSSTPLAIMPRAKLDPRIVRFASLHFKGDDSQTIKPPPQAQQDEQVARSMTLRRFGSLNGFPKGETAQEDSNTSENDRDHIADRNTVVMDYAQTLESEVPTTSRKDEGTHIHPRHIAAMDSTSAAKVGDHAATGVYEKDATVPNATRHSSPSEEDSETEAMVVDLSSFDGTYVQGSLSRSATTYASSESPPQLRPNSLNVTKWPPPEPEQHRHTTETNRNAAPIDNGRNIQDQTIQSIDHESNSSASNPTTIVRILPKASSNSFTSSVQSSPSSSMYRNRNDGVPHKLGDWVLPESPSSRGRSGSGTSSNQEPNSSRPRPLETTTSAYEAQRKKILAGASQVGHISSNPGIAASAKARGTSTPAVAAA